MGFRVGNSKINGIQIFTKYPDGMSYEDFLNGVEPSGDFVIPSNFAFNSSRKCLVLRYTNLTSITYNGTNTSSYDYQGPFIGCKATRVDMPNITKLGWAFFQDLKLCTQFILPKVTTVDRAAFQNCDSVVTLVLPSVVSVINYVFKSTSLKTLDMGKLTSIGTNTNNTFNGCTVLDTMIIRTSSVATLHNINCFTNTPFASGGSGGTLYVPRSLIASYQSASNWVTILGYENNDIKAIEGSQYENYYADGTSIE